MSKARDLAGIFNLGPRSGTTAQRPSTAEVGDIFYNGTTGKTEIYTTTGWKEMASGIPFGNTAGRPANPVVGQPYFNGEQQRLELYAGTGWQNIVSETPGVVSISGNYSEQTNSGTISISGTNFVTGAIASAIGTNGVEINASSTTVNSIVSVTATFTGLSNVNEPYDIKVTNSSNLFGLLPSALYVNATPVWQTASGLLGSFNEQVSISVSATATDSDSTISYALASGSTLPSGVTLNSSTGLISGTLPEITSDTTYSFTINASDGVNTIPRSFSLTSINLTPTEYLVVAGGGGGGNATGTNWGSGGGAGAGGYRTGTLSLTKGLQYLVAVGNGGVGAPKGSTSNNATNGGDSTFSSIVSAGGGAGGSANFNGASGGSGGGGGYNMRSGGSGNTPTQSPSQGSNGGSDTITSAAGGGGGASTAGGNSSSGLSGNGGAGASSSITGTSVTYAGGGGGGVYNGLATAGAGGAGGGGAAGVSSSSASNPGNPGLANTGGGGGGGSSAGSLGADNAGAGGAGGSGVVVIAYPNTTSNIASIPGTLTYTLDTSSRPGYRVYRFTAGTGTVTF
jgi:hypothetical protein